MFYSLSDPKLFGGDMVMTPMEIEALVNGTNAYGSIIGGRWPNGVVPYVIDRSIGKEIEFCLLNNFTEF